jgi:hypothetical protein
MDGDRIKSVGGTPPEASHLQLASERGDRRPYFSKGCFRPTLQPRREIESRHPGLGVA